MSPMHMRLKVALASVLLSTSIVSAQQATGAAVKVTRQAVNATVQRGAREIKSLINGVAVDSDQLPMRYAMIRLRNLQLNAVEHTAIANELGEFSFAAEPNVPYVVEIADQAGRVMAVGDVILASAGEVAGAVVSLPSRLPALVGVFGDSASSVISAATGTGLTVVDPALPKVSPTR